MKSWVEISERDLEANFRALVRAAGPETTVLGVVKANAYGHDAAVCAPVLARAGATWLGVKDAEEGATVRTALAGEDLPKRELDGPEQSRVVAPRVLVMCGMLRSEAMEIVRHGLTPVVWTEQQLTWIAEAAARFGVAAPWPVHVEIDTGMARQGVAPGADLAELLGWFGVHHILRFDGVLTHFASAEVADSALTLAQRRRFEGALGQVRSAGMRPAWMHAGNTSTLDNLLASGEESPMEWLRGQAARLGSRAMVRAGIGLYGYTLPVTAEGGLGAAAGHGAMEGELRPVMTWKARVTGVRELAAGATVGYNGTFEAPEKMRVALLPVGYADGLRRELSGSNARPGGWVMMGGRRAPIVGRISMNLTVVDVTGLGEVQVGDEVTLLGPGVTAEEHARLARTIPYEIVCGVKAPSRLVGVEEVVAAVVG